MTSQLPQRGSVQLGKTALDYTIEGHGTPVWLVMGSSVFYPRTFSSTLKQACTLVCMDLPHFVEASRGADPTTVSFAFYADCIEAVRRAIGVDTVVAVGHSHHGNIAIEYAKRHPAQVSHVILIGSPPVNVEHTLRGADDYWTSRASASRKQQLQQRRARPPTEPMAATGTAAAYIAQYVNDAPLYWYDPTYDASWLWADMRFDMDCIHAFRSLFVDYEMHWRPEDMDAPVLLVMGEEDYAVPPALWDQVPAMKAQVDMHVLGRCGHTPQLEQPEVFDRLVLDWLRQNTSLKAQ